LFDKHFRFNKVGCKNLYTDPNYVVTHIYSFKTLRTRYVVEVEEYLYSIFIIKFYRKRDSRHKNRYNVLTGEFRCSEIVSTCIRILIEILTRTPNASFGFLGSNTITDTYTENKSNTQRFNIYKTAMENLIGDNIFIHAMDTIHSTYLMANRANEPIDEFLLRAKKLFEAVYPELED
jgi:hypothetical protein